MLHEHGLRGTLPERGPNVLGPHRGPPLVVDAVHVQPERLGDPGEALAEVPGHGGDDAIAGREEVRHHGFEPAGPRGREQHDVVRRLHHLL